MEDTFPDKFPQIGLQRPLAYVITVKLWVRMTFDTQRGTLGVLVLWPSSFIAGSIHARKERRFVHFIQNSMTEQRKYMTSKMQSSLVSQPDVKVHTEERDIIREARSSPWS